MAAENEDPLMSYFEKSASRVRDVFGRLEQSVIGPAIKYGENAFRKHPMTATFLSVFALLSALPVLSFIGFSVFVFASTTFVALFLAFALSATIVASITTLLTAVLLLLALFSACISGGAISVYLALRLFALVRADGRAGLSEWSSETKSRFIRGRLEEEKRGRSPSSSGSLVDVKNDSKAPTTEEGVKQE